MTFLLNVQPWNNSAQTLCWKWLSGLGCKLKAYSLIKVPILMPFPRPWWIKSDWSKLPPQHFLLPRRKLDRHFTHRLEVSFLFASSPKPRQEKCHEWQWNHSQGWKNFFLITFVVFEACVSLYTPLCLCKSFRLCLSCTLYISCFHPTWYHVSITSMCSLRVFILVVGAPRYMREPSDFCAWHQPDFT